MSALVEKYAITSPRARRMTPERFVVNFESVRFSPQDIDVHLYSSAGSYKIEMDQRLPSLAGRYSSTM